MLKKHSRRGFGLLLPVLGLSLAACVLTLPGCGGGWDSAGETVAAQQNAPDQVRALAKVRAEASPAAASISAASADPGLLLLLVPDGYSPSDNRIWAWRDAAIEMGVRIAPISDSEFTALGDDALKFAGLVLPDELHSIATDALLDAVKQYVAHGGRAMLTFDFGALTLDGAGNPVYPIPKSRLSDLAGVDYVLYDELRDRTTGLGPVTAMGSMLRDLLVAPGKSMPYPGNASVVLEASVASTDTAYYLPVTVKDPGGVRGYDHQQFLHTKAKPGHLGPNAIDFGHAIKDKPPKAATKDKPAPAKVKPGQETPPPVPDQLEAYSGYGFGFLVYPTYVTRYSGGSTGYDGTTLATSPEFGLVAGQRSYGAGEVLFVNMPLGYLKGRTDALPMHGFLHYFAYDMLNLPYLAGMPNDEPGMVLNWHFDSIEAQAPALALEKRGVFKNGPFSIDFTAGPDDITPGDGLGWNLDNNRTAHDLVGRLHGHHHEIGNHGGWDHDYYGNNVTEDNADIFLPFLILNKESVERALGKGRRTREYSAAMGNNPDWAMSWLEANGIVGAYFGGHTGLGITRQYRDGVLKTPNLWVVPVTPTGMYATFEDFQEFNVPKSTVTAWYHDLIDFSINYRTNRMIYMHPPGAELWVDVLEDMLDYAHKKGDKFRWYTVPRLADFMAKRQQVTWSQSVQPDGQTVFTVTSPAGQSELVWRLPKVKYLKPLDNHSIRVRDGGTEWVVEPEGKGKSDLTLSFTVPPAV